VDADSGLANVLGLPAGQWGVRAAVLLDGRGQRLRDPVGQQYCFAVPGLCPGDRHPEFRGDAPRPAPDARHGFRRMYGRLAARSRRLHEGIRRRPGSTVQVHAHRRVRNVYVLRPARHSAHALDALRRGFPDGSER